MHKKVWSRIGLTAAAILGATAVAGVAGPTAQAADVLNNVSDSALTAAERIASSDVAVPLRFAQLVAGTDYFDSGDLIEEQVNTDGFSWG
ncbi:hypothetical protein [Plantactinospora alkalitolerans]|nr:hypothetical protein [Plantactinospora alkalitolerans]